MASLLIVLGGCAGKHNIPAGATMDLVAIKYDVAWAFQTQSLPGGTDHADDVTERLTREILEMAPGFAEAHYNLAVVLAHQSRLDEALLEFNRALTIMADFELAKTGRDIAQYAVIHGGLPAKAQIPRYCRQFHKLYDLGC